MAQSPVDKHQGSALPHPGSALPHPRPTHLQQVRELGVAEGHVLVLVANGYNHVAQGAEALVDVLRLLHSLPLRPAILHALATRQVNQVQDTADVLACKRARAQARTLALNS